MGRNGLLMSEADQFYQIVLEQLQSMTHRTMRSTECLERLHALSFSDMSNWNIADTQKAGWQMWELMRHQNQVPLRIPPL